VDGVHDLGGRDGFGLVPVEADEPVFHEPWEGRVFAMAGAVTAASPLFGTPEMRHAIERMEPRHYLAASYYERWLTAVATLLVEKGRIGLDELEAAAGGWFPLSRPVRAPRTDAGPDNTQPRFRVGDAVRVKNRHTSGHTRCPGYVRGRRGVVIRFDGPCNFDDVEAHSDGRRVEPLYGVRFDGAELWDEQAEPATSVCVDLFESYLEPG